MGSFTTIIALFAKDYIEQRRKEPRKRLLRKILYDKSKGNWRNMSTLSRVIGPTEEETTRLLIEIKARGSEKEEKVWGYIKDHPLPTDESDDKLYDKQKKPSH